MSDDHALHDKLLDFRNNSDILKEVKLITALINPQFDFHFLDQAFADIEKLFRGQYKGFRACNTHYHDLRHTLTVFLAMARLLHGAYLQGIKFTDKEINIGLLCALMHDAGYIQSDEDHAGTGAKYTLVHIHRSSKFMQEYYSAADYFKDDIKNFDDILNCTGLNIDIEKIKFASPITEMMGKILGTADLLGQMADRFYLEKLVFLFREFAEAKVPGFDSEIDLLQKTVNFYNVIIARFENMLGNVNQYMVHHFRNRWNIEKNLYEEAMKKNIDYLKFILKDNHKNLNVYLRRNAITIQ